MLWDILFFAAALVFIALFWISFIPKVKKATGISTEMMRIIRAAIILVAGFFVFFGANNEWGVDTIRVFLESIYYSARLFLLDGTLVFDQILPNFDYKAIAYMYIIEYLVVCGIAAVISVYTVLSLFKNFFDRGRLKTMVGSYDICVFNELNHQSLATARSLIDNAADPDCAATDGDSGNGKIDCNFFTVKPSGKPVIIFCDVYQQNNEASNELISEAERLGAICFKLSIVEVHKLLRRYKAYKKCDKHIFRYYLFGINENENLHHTNEIVSIEKSEPEDKRFYNLGIFFTAFERAKGLMADSLNREIAEIYQPLRSDGKDAGGSSREGVAGIFVRRLNPALMMAQHIVFDKKNCLIDMDSKDEKEIEKDLNVIVLGLGQYGLEIVKNLCWFYQRKKGGITIHIIDSSPDAEDLMKAKVPGLIEHKFPTDRTEDACFKIKFHQGTDVFGYKFSKMMESEELRNPDAVFVALGDDNSNTEAALRVRTLLDRIHYQDIYDAYNDPDKENPYIGIEKMEQTMKLTDKVKIFAVIHHDENDLSRNENKKFSSGNFNIRFVGMDSLIYSEKNIYDFDAEQQAVELHCEYSRVKTSAAVINSYNSCESDRTSSKAANVHKDFVVTLYGEDYKHTAEQARTESKRWNAYTLSNGIIVVDENMDRKRREELIAKDKASVERRYDRGMWHNGIAPFSEKSQKEQDQNLYM